MSFDTILAKSPSIIFQPGGTPGNNLIATTWAEVQAFIALRQSTVVVYVDDSIAPCHVPASSGVTDCQGRVEIRPRRQDGANFSTLTIDPGATLKSLYKLSGTIFLQCNPTGAVPSLDFDYSVGAFGDNAIPILFVEDNAAIGTATTATTPACVVPAGQQLNMFMENFAEVFMQSASALFSLSAGTIMIVFARSSVFETATSVIPPTWVQGPGRFELSYDAGTVGYTNQGAGGPVLAPGVAFTNAGSEILGAVDGFPDRFNTAFFAIQDLYVNQNGSDTAGNGTEAWPFATIQKALSSISDASTSKRYVIHVAPGEYPGAFNVKPWVAIEGASNSSGFQGTVEITAAANSIGFDPSFATSGFSVFWLSHLVFENQLTFNYSASANQQIQGTFFDVDFNGGGGVGFQFIGAGTAGLDNWTLDNCLVYGGALAQGIQFLFTIGGTEFLGGTVTVQAAPSAGALESTTWLAQNTAVGSAFSPTNVHVLWAAPTPAVHLSALDWNNTNSVGQINLDGASSSAKITGLRPANVIQSNGASPATVQPLTIELLFSSPGTFTNVLSLFQSSGVLPTTGAIRIDCEGYGSTGGGGGGAGGGAAPGAGGGGSGGAIYQMGSFDFNLSHALNITVPAGGAGGAAGAAPAGAGGNGVDGSPAFAEDAIAGIIVATFTGSSAGGGTGATGASHGGANYGPGVFVPRLTDVAAPYGSGFPAGGGLGGLQATSGTAGQGSYFQSGPAPLPTGRFAGGVGGTSAAGEGGGGGGGGAGPLGSAGAGGNANPAGSPGSPGGNASLNSGAGAGGGAGGSGLTDNGGAGGTGDGGYFKMRLVVQ
jgi:hypothetical protein